MPRRVLLVSMPWQALERPSLGLSLLRAALRRDGVQCDVRYLGFMLADLIGVPDYLWVQDELPHTAFAGEWLFTRSLYGHRADADQGYVEEVLRGVWRLDGPQIDRLLRLRPACDAFLDACVEAVDWSAYDIVGFTSTFEQNIASLALARRIKRACPGVRIVFGGANWEGEMGEELRARFPFVDAAFSGEADVSFPAYVRDETLPEDAPIADLDRLPIPDYDDYFAALRRSSAAGRISPLLLLETSRGCWWGAKHHCTFCGLNGELMTFRSKTPERVLAEIEELRRYGPKRVAAVDNILDMRYFRTVLPALAAAGPPFTLFYEVKANLTAGQVRTLAAAGVRRIQPGLESLNDHVLALMRKGTTALRNIQTLKWCAEFGVTADWNVLYGFPGETAGDYAQMASLIDAVDFLTPPTGLTPIRLDRFSPLFADPAGFGLTCVQPLAPYKYLYPFSEKSLRRLAYYFDFQYADGRDTAAYTGAARRRVARWIAEGPARGPEAYRRPDGGIFVTDPRQPASYLLTGWQAAVYARCDKVTSGSAAVTLGAGRGAAPEQVREFLAYCLDRRLMARVGDQWLALAVHRPPRENPDEDHPTVEVQMAERILTALVVLQTSATEGQLTADQIAGHLPPPGVVAGVTRWFQDQGFETGATVGIAFAITAPRDRFTSLLGEPGLDRTLDLSRLPGHVREHIEAITVTPPPAFGPGDP
jgi:ribosomal peptide maturation radical SAM protein 1